MTFSANGQVVAQRVRQGTGTPAYYSLHTDHLGNVAAVAAVADSAGVYVPNSYAVYEPFGAFLTTPTGTNPGVSDRGGRPSAPAHGPARASPRQFQYSTRQHQRFRVRGQHHQS